MDDGAAARVAQIDADLRAGRYACEDGGAAIEVLLDALAAAEQERGQALLDRSEWQRIAAERDAAEQARDAARKERDKARALCNVWRLEHQRLARVWDAREARLAALEEAARAWVYRGHSYPEWDAAEHALRDAVRALDVAPAEGA